MPVRPDIDRDVLAASYRAGASLSELGRRYSSDNRTLKRILERAGVAIRTAAQSRRLQEAIKKIGHRHPKEADILAYYANGVPARDVSRLLGVHHAMLIRVLKQNGVKPRTHSEGKALQMRRLTHEERCAVTAKALASLQAKRDAGWVRPNKGQGRKTR